MRIFLDTNVVMDYLMARGNVEAIDQIFKTIEEGLNTAFISIGSYYTITYLTEQFLKEAGYRNPVRLAKLRKILSTLLLSIEVTGNTRSELLAGTNDLYFKDLEDSYQYQAAMASSCTYLITN